MSDRARNMTNDYPEVPQVIFCAPNFEEISILDFFRTPEERVPMQPREASTSATREVPLVEFREPVWSEGPQARIVPPDSGPDEDN